MEISIVIPVYNSEDSLENLVLNITEGLKEISTEYEIILVNDSSFDTSWEVIQKISKLTSQIKAINLRKNFGQDNALMAGLVHSAGNKIVIMDDDMQQNPKDIPKLIEMLNAKNDVCYGHFVPNHKSWLKNLGSFFNDKCANLFLNKQKKIYLSPFKALHKEIKDEIIKYDGPFPYIDGLIFRVTNKITQIEVENSDRRKGKSNYTLLKSLVVWSNLATNFSVIPLRFATILGFIAAIMGFLSGLYFLVEYFIGTSNPEGWQTTILTILFLS